MEKKIFSNDQERQILEALDDMDADIGINKLDDEKGLKKILGEHTVQHDPNHSKKNSSWFEVLGLSWVSRASGALVSPGYVFVSSVLILSLIPLTIFQTQQLNEQRTPSSPDALRGAKEIYQIVDRPKEELLQFTSSLVTLGIAYEVSFQPDGAIRLTFPATEEADGLLIQSRIIAPKATHYVLIFEKSR